MIGSELYCLSFRLNSYFFLKNQYGISNNKATKIFIIKSPTASDVQSGTSAPTLKNGVGNGRELFSLPNQISRKANGAAKARPKNNIVSIIEPMKDEIKGANHQLKERRRLKIEISKNCAIKKALPDAIAMRGLARKIDQITAIAKPMSATFLASFAPKYLLVKSVTKNAIG